MVQLVKLVDEILIITRQDNYLDNENAQGQVKQLQKKIDELVYKLYNLTSEEIALVEGE